MKKVGKMKKVGISVFFFGVLIILSFGYFLFVVPKMLSEGEQVLFGVLLLALAGVALLIFIGPLATVFLLGIFNVVKKDGEEGAKSILFHVSKNYKWVLRNVWQSNPRTLEGYQEKEEGWRVWLPKVWQSDEGLVNLAPVQLDVPPYTVNCTDGVQVQVDTRITYFVRQEDGVAIKFVVNIPDGKAGELIIQRVKVALNRAMDATSDDAIAWPVDKKEKYSDAVDKMVNEFLKDDGGKDYGIEAVVNIENISATPVVMAARDREAAAVIERRAAENEAETMETMIDKTGANATAVMVAQTIADAVRGIFSSKTSKSGGTKSKSREAK